MFYEYLRNQRLAQKLSNEIIVSKYCLIRLVQQTHYFREYGCLLEIQPIKNKSTLLSLAPFLDSNSIMRVRGRLEYSTWSYDERQPINHSYKITFILFTY